MSNYSWHASPSRRDFLRLLLATPVALHYDLDRLLWVPRQQVAVLGMFTLPFTVTQVNGEERHFATLNAAIAWCKAESRVWIPPGTYSASSFLEPGLLKRMRAQQIRESLNP